MPTVNELRRAVDDLHTLAAADLRDLWAQVTNAVEAREALADILPMLVQTYGSAAATVAADWYDELRDELDVAGRFSAIVPDLGPQGTDSLAGWAVAPLFDEEPDWQRAQVLTDGGLQLRIANAARETVRFSSIEDPQAQGWQRVASGGCAFCQLLAGRGEVFSEASADFAAHDHCRCFAAPSWKGHPRPVRPYTPSERDISDADRARVREYLRSH